MDITMALSKRTENTTATTTETTATAAGSFEDMEGTTTVTETGTNDKAEIVAEAAANPAAAEAEASAQRALAEARSTALASPLAKTEVMVSKLCNVIPPDQLEQLGFGVFPRITVALDGFWVDRDKRGLGNEIVFEVLSWNRVWLVTTGEKDNTPETNKLIRTSYDGKNLKGGEGTVDAYVAKLKAMEYDKASCKQYVELYGNLISSAKHGVEDEAGQSKLYQVSVSPQSASKFGALELELRVAKMRGKSGIADTSRFKLTQESKMVGANKFGIISFAAVAPDAVK